MSVKISVCERSADDYVSFSADKTMSCMMNELSFGYVGFLAVQFFQGTITGDNPAGIL